jgi:hypothetical protein
MNKLIPIIKNKCGKVLYCVYSNADRIRVYEQLLLTLDLIEHTDICIDNDIGYDNIIKNERKFIVILWSELREIFHLFKRDMGILLIKDGVDMDVGEHLIFRCFNIGVPKKMLDYENIQFMVGLHKLREFMDRYGHRPFKVVNYEHYYLSKWFFSLDGKKLHAQQSKYYKGMCRMYKIYLERYSDTVENHFNKWLGYYYDIMTEAVSDGFHKRLFSDNKFSLHKRWLWEQVNQPRSTVMCCQFMLKLWHKLDEKTRATELLTKKSYNRKRRIGTEEDMDNLLNELYMLSQPYNDAIGDIDYLKQFINNYNTIPLNNLRNNVELKACKILEKGRESTDKKWIDFFDQYNEYFEDEKYEWHCKFIQLKKCINNTGAFPTSPPLRNWFKKQNDLYNKSCMKVEGSERLWRLFKERYSSVIDFNLF